MANIVVNDRIFNNIQELLIKHDISAKQLALVSSLSESEISYIKNGVHTPNLLNVYQIVHGFRCLGIDVNIPDVFECNIDNVNFM
jgi:transcriptional regulator with XRE-family HTH domain